MCRSDFASNQNRLEQEDVACHQLRCRWSDADMSLRGARPQHCLCKWLYLTVLQCKPCCHRLFESAPHRQSKSKHARLQWQHCLAPCSIYWAHRSGSSALTTWSRRRCTGCQSDDLCTLGIASPGLGCLLVRQWTLKRPQLLRQKHTKKRTPLTAPRKHSVRSGGVKPNK